MKTRQKFKTENRSPKIKIRRKGQKSRRFKQNHKNIY